jgi:ribonuclease P protein component
MSRAVFTNQQKLNQPSEFKWVFSKPVVSSDSFFRVLARVGQGKNSRLGMAVSRQVDRKAVVRNRIKRVIRESFRKRFSGTDKRLDIIVLPRRETATTCNTELFRSLQSHWSRLESRFEG